jgi:molybdenum cofactor cytidylyltransferase
LTNSGTAAVILAAGGSVRLGKPKQLIQYRGQSLVRRSIEVARQAECDPIAVVADPNSPEMADELHGVACLLVKNEKPERGIGSSIRAGIQTLVTFEPAINGVVMLVCDQYLVEPDIIEKLIAAHFATRKDIAASHYAGTLGIPAYFASSCFEELLSLPDDQGAKSVIQRNPARVVSIPFAEGAFDIDTADDLENLRSRVPGGGEASFVR